MALSEQEREVLRRFRDAVQTALPDEEPELVLFGSKARGDDGPDSDVDVLVRVNSDEWRIRDRVYEIVTRLLLDSGIDISPKVVSRSKFAQMKESGAGFAKNVIQDAVAV